MAYQGNNRYTQQKRDFGPKRNEYIRVYEIQVIDKDGNNLGAMKTFDALKLAQEDGLDLVEISPNTTPPVCRIIDYAKYTYEQKKRERERRVAKKELKELVFSPVIDVHDKETRIRRAKEFLSKGHQVRLTMQKKKRHSYELAKEVFADILTNFVDYITIEPESKTEGNRIFVTYKPNGKIKNKQNSIKKSEGNQSEGKQEA